MLLPGGRSLMSLRMFDNHDGVLSYSSVLFCFLICTCVAFWALNVLSSARMQASRIPKSVASACNQTQVWWFWTINFFCMRELIVRNLGRVWQSNSVSLAQSIHTSRPSTKLSRSSWIGLKKQRFIPDPQFKLGLILDPTLSSLWIFKYQFYWI